LVKLTEFVALEAMVYEPLATRLFVRFGAAAKALIVLVALIGSGTLYWLLDVVGVVPSVV
jgi:hypothetical protein